MSRWSGQSARTVLLQRLIQGMAAIGSLAVAGIILVTVVDVIGREFGLPVKGAYDWVRVLGAVAMGCALPLTKAVKGHIAIEYFFQKMGPRGRAVADTLMRVVLLLIFGLLTERFIRQGIQFRESGETTMTVHLPMFWVPWVIAAGCALTAVVTVWHLLHPGRSLLRPS